MHLKNYRKFLPPILILIILVTYAFRDMLDMIVVGQGFEYLIKESLVNFWKSLPYSLASYEISSVLLGLLGYKFFGLNFSLYYWTWLIITLVVSILLFFLVYAVTGKKWVAFSASLINTVCYASQMGLIGWVDTSFTGRVPNLIFLIPSFTFLHLLLKQSKLSYYFASIVLYFLGIGLGQFGLLLGFVYIFYPLFWHLLEPRTKKKSDRTSSLIKRVLVSLSFVLVSLFFVKTHSSNVNPQGPTYSFTHFLFHPRTYHYLDKIPLQLANWSNYPNLTKGIYFRTDDLFPPSIEYRGNLTQFFADIKANKDAALGITLFYFLASIFMYFRLPKQRALLAAIISATLVMFAQNVYINHYLPAEQPGASRYLLYPTIWLAVFWALFLWGVFWKNKNRQLRTLGIAFLGAYYLVNTGLIQETLNGWLHFENSYLRGAAKLFTYIQDARPELEPNTLIITPLVNLGCYEDVFLNQRLGRGEVTYWPDGADDNCLHPPDSLEKIISNSSHVIRLHYDNKCNCVTEEKIK